MPHAVTVPEDGARSSLRRAAALTLLATGSCDGFRVGVHVRVVRVSRSVEC